MIRWIRTAKIAHGFNPEAIKWAIEVVNYTNPKYHVNNPVKVFTEIVGETGIVKWMRDYENLAELESIAQKVQNDPGYMERLKAVAGLFQPGIYDKVYALVG